jgi:hypothetical protein
LIGADVLVHELLLDSSDEKSLSVDERASFFLHQSSPLPLGAAAALRTRQLRVPVQADGSVLALAALKEALKMFAGA